MIQSNIEDPLFYIFVTFYLTVNVFFSHFVACLLLIIFYKSVSCN